MFHSIKKPRLHATLLVCCIILAGFFISRELSFKGTVTTTLGSLPITPQTAAVADFNSNLILHYTFDDGTATDMSGKGNNGTVSGGTAGTGKVGGGLEMASGNSILTTIMSTIPDQGFTFSAWVKTTSSSNQVFFKKGSGHGATDLSYVFGNRLYFQRDGGTDLAARTNSSVVLTPDTWYHIAMTWDGSITAANVHIYVNGIDKPHDINGDGASPNTNSTSLTLFPQWSGTIDDVRIYDKVLSSQEVQDVYSALGDVPPPPTPVTCTSFEYSSWGTCSNGTQTRTVTSKSPSGCTGGSPVTTQSCTVELPADAPASITAASCEADIVQTAINAVKDQGIVLVPEGTCTWTKSVGISGKSIILKGAGIDKTTIIENLSSNGHSLNTSIALGKPVRITGFTFDGSKTKDNYASVAVGGPPGSPLFRIDHVKFINITERGIITNGVYGLIDHNIFIRKSDGSSPTLISVFGGDADASWLRPQDMGTSNAVFIEDNIFVHNIGANGPFDMYRGARYVFRDNNVYGSNLGHHGFDSDLRGEVNFEVYNNCFVNAAPAEQSPYVLHTYSNCSINPLPATTAFKHGLVFEFRSGSGVIFDNTVTRVPTENNGGYYDSFTLLRNYRSGDGYVANSGGTIPWDSKHPWNGVCNGTNSFDGNMPGMYGYPCKDQIGRTSGFGSDGKQTLSPVYSWNNNFQGKIGGNIVAGGYATFMCPKINSVLVSKNDKPASGEPYSWVCKDTITGVNYTMYDYFNLHIVEGRDFFNGVPRPGYAPYIYPHPLQTSGFTSDAGGPVVTVPVGNPAPDIQIPIVLPTTPKKGDFNNDGAVNALDFSILSTHWNQNNVTYDLNADGTINSLDYVILVRNWTG